MSDGMFDHDAAWREATDKLAEAMRREQLGEVRPLWADLPLYKRGFWLGRAEHVQHVLARGGYVIARPSPSPAPAGEGRGEGSSR